MAREGMKTFRSIMDKLIAAVDRCVTFSFWAAAVLLFFLGPIAFYEVVVRKLGHPTTWTFHILVYSQLFMIWFGVPYTQKVRGHVEVDIITRLLPLTVRIITRIFAYLVCQAISIILVWQSWVMIKRSYVYELMTTEEFLHPVYWLQIPTFIGAIFLFLVFFCQTYKDVNWLFTREGPPPK